MWIIAYGIIVEKEHYYVNESLVRVVIYCIYSVFTKKVNNYIKEKLSQYDNVKINSNKYSIPHILNLSVMNAKPESMQHALEEYDIYISTQSACSSNNPVSKAVFEVTKDEEAAKHSIRVSLSGFTTKNEVDTFLSAFDKCINKFNELR